MFFDLLDMSEVLSLHATFETAQYQCLVKKLHADLRLCWFVGNLGLLKVIKSNQLKHNFTGEVMLQTGKIGDDLSYYFSSAGPINPNFVSAKTQVIAFRWV